MGIKYHQYGCGNDYGDDHYLTDNWNPDYDYGSQYVEVYFNKSIYKLKENHDILYPVLVSIAETHKDMFDFCKDQN